MEFQAGVDYLGSAELKAVVASAEAEGLPLYVVTTSTSVRRGTTFIEAARDAIPLDPQLEGDPNHWDAFADSLSGGLLGADGDLQIVVWMGADKYRKADPDGYRLAVGVMEQVSEEAGESRYTGGNPKAICFYLEG